jgi:hypothetical protein
LDKSSSLLWEFYVKKNKFNINVIYNSIIFLLLENLVLRFKYCKNDYKLYRKYDTQNSYNICVLWNIYYMLFKSNTCYIIQKLVYLNPLYILFL